MEGMGEETLPFPLLKSGKCQKVHLGRSVSTHFVADWYLLTMYGYCQEKIDVGHYWDLKGLRERSFQVKEKNTAKDKEAAESVRRKGHVH